MAYFPRSVALSLCIAAGLHAQDINASLSGTVSDSSGAVIPNASIQIVNANTGVVGYRGATNASGIYSAPSLPVGVYRIFVEAPGFKKAEIQGVTLQVDQRARVNVTLAPGEVAETITVVGESLGQLESESSSTGALINTSQVRDLPDAEPEYLQPANPGGWSIRRRRGHRCESVAALDQRLAHAQQ